MAKFIIYNEESDKYLSNAKYGKESYQKDRALVFDTYINADEYIDNLEYNTDDLRIVNKRLYEREFYSRIIICNNIGSNYK